MDRQSPSRSILFLHGLGGGPYELGPLIEAARAAGHEISAPVFPGHEGPGPGMPASRWQEWAKAAEAAFDTLAAPDKRIAVVGFSTGGTLALRLACRRPVDRLVLLAPFLAIRYAGLIPLRPASYLEQIARFFPELPRRGPAVRDAAARAAVAGMDRFRTFNLLAALSALELIDEVAPLVPSITTPTLIIQGKRDTVVDPTRAAWLDRMLGSREKTLLSLHRSDHLVALDHDREQVAEVVLEFLQG